jgi:hypothetical protein
MSKLATSDSLWAEMSEAQRIETVREGRATLKEMVEGLLDGSDKLREACREFLARTDASFKELQIETDEEQQLEPDVQAERAEEETISDYTHAAMMDPARKRRQGLPKGYVPKVYRR